MNWRLLANSLLVSGVTTVLAGALGFAVALVLTSVGHRWRRALLLAAVIALVLPPFLVANCWLELLGNDGAWRGWLPLNIYSLAGASWLLALIHWPLTALLVLGAWSRLEMPQLECDPMVRGWALVRGLLWPMASGAVGQAAVLTFVLALNNFSIPVILQVRVFPEELWLAFTTRLNEAGAWAAALPMIIAPAVGLLLLRRTNVSWPNREGAVTAQAFRRQLGRGWFVAGAAATVVLLFLAVVLPLQQLVLSSRTWSELPNLLRAAPDTVWNSFTFAAVTASLCVGIGLVSWRLRAGLFLWLLFLLPGILLGRSMIAVLDFFDSPVIYGTVALVVLAFALRYVALAWTVIRHARTAVDRDVVDAGRVSGAAGWPLFRRIVWPQIAPQVAAVWYLTYLLCLWEVETLVLIYPPGGETLALRIFNLLHYGHHAQVNAMCVTLLALALAPLALWSAWRWIRAKVAGR
jgi:iron(III) transport system permease protein